MAISGTTAFDLPVDEIINEAWRRAGVYDNLTADHARVGRLCLNLVLQDLQNEGVLLWQTEIRSTPLVAGTQSYILPADTNDVLQGSIIRNESRVTIERLSQEQWLDLAKESTQSRPNHFRIDRFKGAVTAYFWPIPDSGEYTFEYVALKKPNDITRSNQNIDVPQRLLPAVIAMLAAQLYDGQFVDGEFHLPKLNQLNQKAATALSKALLEDRERTNFFIRPNLRPYSIRRR